MTNDGSHEGIKRTAEKREEAKRVAYRALNGDDFDGVYALVKRCFAAPWTAEETKNALFSPYFSGVGAFFGEEVIGFLLGNVLFETAEIDYLAVDGAFRRCGIAEKLLETFEQTAADKGAENVFLEVREGNAAARGLYEKAGYALVRIRRRYYENGEDAHELKKAIARR